MKLAFTKVRNEAQIATVARLARVIWREYYSPLVGSAQVEYMLDKFQSAAAVAGQIGNEDYRYFLLEMQGVAVGYLAFYLQGQVLFLSKLYVLQRERGKGIGKKSLDFVADCGRQMAMESIRLIVIRKNTSAIEIYRKYGFAHRGNIVSDFGSGYIMDDYVFEKKLR